jgi:WD40 repeat protein
MATKSMTTYQIWLKARVLISASMAALSGTGCGTQDSVAPGPGMVFAFRHVPTELVGGKIPCVGRYRTAAFSSDGALALTGGDDKTARLWRVSSGKAVAILNHDSAVCEVAFSPRGDVLTKSDDGIASLWTVSGRLTVRFGITRALAISPDGKVVVTASRDIEDRNARVWYLDSGRTALLKHDGPVNAVAFSHDGRRILTGSFAYTGGSPIGTARLWSTDSGESIASFDHCYRSPVTIVAFGPDDRSFLSACIGARLWSLDSNVPAYGFSSPPGTGGVLTGTMLSPDGTALLNQGGGGTHASLDLWRIIGPEQPGVPIDATPQGVAPAKTFRDGQLVAHLANDTTINDFAFSPDSRMVVVGVYREARLWRVASGQQVAVLSHTADVNAVAFSKDGRIVITAAGTGVGARSFGEARIWSADSGELLMTLDNEAGVRAVAFSPDSHLALTVSEDAVARLWRLDRAQSVPSRSPEKLAR